MRRSFMSLLLALLTTPAFAINDNSSDNVIPHPSAALAEKRLEAARKKACEANTQVTQEGVEFKPLELGQLYLYGEQLVLIRDGQYHVPGGVSNFWSWVEILPLGFGRTLKGYDDDKRFTSLPKGTTLWVDLRTAVTHLRNDVSPHDVNPTLFRTEGELVVLLKTGQYYNGGHYEFRIRYLEVDAHGKVGSTVKTKVTTHRTFVERWHPVRGFRLSVSGVR